MGSVSNNMIFHDTLKYSVRGNPKIGVRRPFHEFAVRPDEMAAVFTFTQTAVDAKTLVDKSFSDNILGHEESMAIVHYFEGHEPSSSKLQSSYLSVFVVTNSRFGRLHQRKRVILPGWLW